MRSMADRRILAVEGGSFSKYNGRATPVAFLLTEGIRPRKLVFKSLEVDGMDATRRLLEVVEEQGWGGGEHKIGVVMSSSVPIAGFNLIDARQILERLGVPTVFVLSEMPDEVAVESALRKHFKDWEARLDIIRRAGPVKRFDLEGESILLECVGIPETAALGIARQLLIFGNVPEPLRIARMACRAFTGI